MATKNQKTVKTTAKTEQKKAKEEPKKVSKTWLAALKNVGTGEIIDMRAVLK